MSSIRASWTPNPPAPMSLCACCGTATGAWGSAAVSEALCCGGGAFLFGIRRGTSFGWALGRTGAGACTAWWGCGASYGGGFWLWGSGSRLCGSVAAGTALYWSKIYRGESCTWHCSWFHFIRRHRSSTNTIICCLLVDFKIMVTVDDISVRYVTTLKCSLTIEPPSVPYHYITYESILWLRRKYNFVHVKW